MERNCQSSVTTNSIMVYRMKCYLEIVLVYNYGSGGYYGREEF